MQEDRDEEDRRPAKFYLIATSHTDLAVHYRLVFNFKEYRGGGVWAVDEVESMIPYEAQLYITQMLQAVEERREAERQARQRSG